MLVVSSILVFLSLITIVNIIPNLHHSSFILGVAFSILSSCIDNYQIHKNGEYIDPKYHFPIIMVCISVFVIDYFFSIELPFWVSLGVGMVFFYTFITFSFSLPYVIERAIESVDAIDKYEELLRSLQEEIKELGYNNSELKTIINELEIEKINQQEAITKLNDQKLELEQQSLHFNNKGILQKEQTLLQKEIELNNKEQEITKKISFIEKELSESHNTKNQELQTELDLLKSKLDNVQENIKNNQHNIEDLQKQLQEERERQKQINQINQDLEKETEALNKKIKAINTEKEKLEKQLKENQRKIRMADYLDIFKKMEKHLRRLTGSKNPNIEIYKIIDQAYQQGTISRNLKDSLHGVREKRNTIVHQDGIITEKDLEVIKIVWDELQLADNT